MIRTIWWHWGCGKMPGPLSPKHGRNDQELAHLTVASLRGTSHVVENVAETVAIPVLETTEWNGRGPAVLGVTVLQDEVLLGKKCCPDLEESVRSPHRSTAITISGLGDSFVCKEFVLKA